MTFGRLRTELWQVVDGISTPGKTSEGRRYFVPGPVVHIKRSVDPAWPRMSHYRPPPAEWVKFDTWVGEFTHYRELAHP
jgi:hypothetical protein